MTLKGTSLKYNKYENDAQNGLVNQEKNNQYLFSNYVRGGGGPTRDLGWSNQLVGPIREIL